MKKKGYYFIVDSLIAAMILVIGYLLVSSFYISKPERLEIKSSADNIINFLSETKLLDLCTLNGKCSDEVLEEYFNDIKNKDNTLLEIIGELFYREKLESISKIINSIVVENKMIPLGYNLTFFIADNVVYPPEQFDMTREYPVMKKSKALVTSKKVIFGYFEPAIYWGPYTAEARIWRLEHFIRCKTDADCLGGECDIEYEICTDSLVKAGDFCCFTCNDDRFECKGFPCGECVRKQTDLGQYCENEAACGPGYYCYKMQCVYTPGDINDPCGYNNDCNQGLICDNGICSPVYGNEGDDCSTTGKCGVGLYCNNGICESTTGGVGKGCDSDSDCEHGKICVSGKCEEGTYNENKECESNEECGPGLVCNGATGKCESTSGQQETDCGSDNDCDIGLICVDNICQLGTDGLGEECDEQSDCGDGLICDMTLEPPECVVTEDGAGAICFTDSDCSTGFYCDDFKCINGQSEVGSSCTTQEDCGAGLVCIDGVCVTTDGNPCDLCYSFSDCNKHFEDIGNTICIEGICYLPNNENGDCSELGYCQCGPGLFCFIYDIPPSCQITNGMWGDPCNTDADCKSGLKCEDGICEAPGDIDETNICGDGIIDSKTEQCEGGTTTCSNPDLNCEGASTVHCNAPGTENECRWDKTVCDCPVCDFPADCTENCAVSPGEAIWLINQLKKNSEPYYCGGRNDTDFLTPTGKMAGCSLALYSKRSYDIDWTTVVVLGLGDCTNIPRKEFP